MASDGRDKGPQMPHTVMLLSAVPPWTHASHHAVFSSPDLFQSSSPLSLYFPLVSLPIISLVLLSVAYVSTVSLLVVFVTPFFFQVIPYYLPIK